MYTNVTIAGRTEKCQSFTRIGSRIDFKSVLKAKDIGVKIIGRYSQICV